jgi:hypothetical protein
MSETAGWSSSRHIAALLRLGAIRLPLDAVVAERRRDDR